MLAAHTHAAHGPSLESVQPGRTVRIASILFESLRAHCHRLGLQEGDTVVVVARHPGRLVLAARAGAHLHLDRSLARFVQVVPAAGARPGRGPSRGTSLPA